MVPLGQAAEWVIVPWYCPTTTPAGMVTTIVGFHVADVPLDAVTAENAVRADESDWAAALVASPGRKVAAPVVDVAGPDQ